jgi:superfamily II DNA or RNA helicase
MEGDALDQADALVERVEEEGEQQLPIVETRDVLASLGLQAISSADEEAVEFLIASGIAKIWKHAYRDEAAAVAQAEAFRGEGYAEEIRRRFLDEYRQVKELTIPEGYAFRINGELTPPNLMQRHFAVRVQEWKRVGNWSGTGAGKTLAAVLATRVVGSKLTVICCPNSVVEGWRRAIRDIFPDSIVAAKTFAPDWAIACGDGTGFGVAPDRGAHRYLTLNYEAFQQPDSAERVRSLTAGELIDFVIVDEIHYAKQRSEDMSQRRQLVAALTTLAAQRNPDLHVLGMSATPVINNLQEGKSMVELVTGLAHDELDIRSTVPNCMALHQRLVTLGIRWMPEYRLRYEQREIEVDCGPLLDEIRALGGKGTPLALEQILTRARLPVIRAHVEPKTLLYTHYVQGIDRLLRDALVEEGWKVGFFTGEDKSGLDGFLEGDVDVLIGSSAIGTGVDGLQQVCNRLIVNVLPWTAAEFEQLKGRVYRQGQSRANVTMILPLTYAAVHGERWSWCESKMHRLRFKKSIADAAVDGVVPEGHLRTPAQAYQDVMAWLERLDAGEVEVITRPRIVVPLPDTDPTDVKRRRRRYGDFSTMNRTWNQTRSDTTHARLRANPEEWAQYHTLYREARKDWAVVPYEEMIRWCRQRSGYVIGDFGCGEAKLAEAVSDHHTVHSFDHVAVNENVVACDMAHVPLDDDTLDVAIFSLSLMGANFADYLREGYRTLKLDGQLHILEATERFTDRNAFVKALEGLGFAIVSVEDKWKFTHIRALKTERQPREDLDLRF